MVPWWSNLVSNVYQQHSTAELQDLVGREGFEYELYIVIGCLGDEEVFALIIRPVLSPVTAGWNIATYIIYRYPGTVNHSDRYISNTVPPGALLLNSG